MALRYFITSLFIVSLAILFISMDDIKTESDIQEKPTMIFHHAVIYNITKDGVQSAINTTKANIYKTKEEAYNVNALLKTNDLKVFDSLISNYAIKKGDNLTFVGDVIFQRSDFVKVHTQEMNYNIKDKIAYNNVQFEAYYYNHRFDGINFYSKDNNYIKSTDVKFNIELKD